MDDAGSSSFKKIFLVLLSAVILICFYYLLFYIPKKDLRQSMPAPSTAVEPAEVFESYELNSQSVEDESSALPYRRDWKNYYREFEELDDLPISLFDNENKKLPLNAPPIPLRQPNVDIAYSYPRDSSQHFYVGDTVPIAVYIAKKISDSFLIELNQNENNIPFKRGVVPKRMHYRVSLETQNSSKVKITQNSVDSFQVLGDSLVPLSWLFDVELLQPGKSDLVLKVSFAPDANNTKLVAPIESKNFSIEILACPVSRCFLDYVGKTLSVTKETLLFLFAFVGALGASIPIYWFLRKIRRAKKLASSKSGSGQISTSEDDSEAEEDMTATG